VLALPPQPIQGSAPKQDGAAIAQLIRQSLEEAQHDPRRQSETGARHK
jgi:hypothetical protein